MKKRTTILLTIVEIVLGVFLGWKIGTGQERYLMPPDHNTLVIGWQYPDSLLPRVNFIVYKFDKDGLQKFSTPYLYKEFPRSTLQDSTRFRGTAVWLSNSIESDLSTSYVDVFLAKVPPPDLSISYMVLDATAMLQQFRIITGRAWKSGNVYRMFGWDEGKTEIVSVQLRGISLKGEYTIALTSTGKGYSTDPTAEFYISVGNIVQDVPVLTANPPYYTHWNLVAGTYDITVVAAKMVIDLLEFKIYRNDIGVIKPLSPFGYKASSKP